MSFPHIGAENRSDESFRNREDLAHHREYTIIEQLPINMITDFSTSDCLHLLHLGIMKKLLLLWMGLSDNFEFKWTQSDVTDMNRLLAECNTDLPSDVHRAVRNLNYVKFFKGTEFRLFLNYIGIVVLKKSLREQEYSHFLKLHCAVILCSHDNYLKYLDLAHDLFIEYIEEYIELYGIDSIGSNVHNLSHVVDDVKRLGNLTKLNTYPFENVLYSLKLKLRPCSKPLEQIARRIIELNLDYRDPVDLSGAFQNISRETEFKYVIDSNATNKSYKQVSLGPNSFLSSRSFGDKWFLTYSNQIVEFHSARKLNGNIFLRGCAIKVLENFFTQPFSSKNISTYSAKYEKFSARNYTLKDVKAKMMCLHYEDRLVFIPLLHTL